MMGPVLQTILEDRFRLKVHKEMREVQAYAPSVAKGGPKLQQFKERSCISDNREIAPDHILDALLAVAKDLRGARVAHINAPPYGGGISELLRSAAPIMDDLGLSKEWKTISERCRGGDNFYPFLAGFRLWEDEPVRPARCLCDVR